MKAVLVGFGRMGKETETVLLQRGHEVVGIIDPVLGKMTEDAALLLLRKADVAIEFAKAEGVIGNASLYARARVPAVVGTTGWQDKRDAVRELVEKAGTAYLWGSNFSIGAHLFLRMVDRLAELYDSVPGYDILAYELHHNQKADSPSGTAMTVGSHILAHTKRKRRIVTDRLDRKIEPEELHIGSMRGGAIPGIHTVLIDSPADTIELTHSVRSRSGLASGSVLAAEWLIGKTGFIDIEFFIDELLRRAS